MLVIGGVIGTGLFLGTAGNLHNGGPAGLLISYCIMASLLYAVMVGLGEMIAAFPIAGGHVSLIGRYSSPELSFAVGWLYWYCYISEYSCSCTSPCEECRECRHVTGCLVAMHMLTCSSAAR